MRRISFASSVSFPISFSKSAAKLHEKNDLLKKMKNRICQKNEIPIFFVFLNKFLTKSKLNPS